MGLSPFQPTLHMPEKRLQNWNSMSDHSDSSWVLLGHMDARQGSRTPQKKSNSILRDSAAAEKGIIGGRDFLGRKWRL